MAPTESTKESAFCGKFAFWVRWAQRRIALNCDECLKARIVNVVVDTVVQYEHWSRFPGKGTGALRHSKIKERNEQKQSCRIHCVTAGCIVFLSRFLAGLLLVRETRNETVGR